MDDVAAAKELRDYADDMQQAGRPWPALRQGASAIETLAKIREELKRQRREASGDEYDDWYRGINDCCAAIEALLEPKP